MTKKSIQKPENWQDFETLCKKLWGEILEIPFEIKKNGRSGQTQHGVDVYGIPKGETDHFGIQCKGKDNYTDAKLTEAEVDSEIEKAKKFKPQLRTFVFATTANKDAKIEEYIRLKNDENEFKILLYCWEDIADLIEEHRHTHDWYVKNLMHRTNFDFRVLFNDFQEQITLTPTLSRQVTKFVYTEQSLEQIIEETKKYIDESHQRLKDIENTKVIAQSIFRKSDLINKSWTSFDIILENSGSTVLEDWYFDMKFKSGVFILDDKSTGLMLGNISTINIDKDDPRYIDKEEKSISYNPVGKTVLVQKENRHFQVSVLVETKAKEIVFEWELIARDFSKSGTGTILVEPTYHTITKEEDAISPEYVKEEIKIEYYRVKG